MTHYLGIDPGLTGAVGIVDIRGDLVDVYDMPVVAGQVNAVDLALSFDQLAKHLNGFCRYVHGIVAVPKYLLSQIEAKPVELP